VRDELDSRGHCPQNLPPKPKGLGATLSRREFLRLAGAGALLSAAASACRARPKARPEARPDHPLVSFDREVEKFMAARKVPGGALAVVKDRRLVWARGYGWADREAQEPVRPESLFRIASISKPITAVATLQLVEQGRLGLDQAAFDLLPIEPFVPAGRAI
jgi:N-acyl-D-amino-acid deacylase